MEVFDTAIVGGGAIGCAIALRLAKAGVRVCVVERTFPGAEASSAAGGILAPRAESGGPGPFLDLCLKSAALYPALAEELRADTGIDVAYNPCGLLEVARDEKETEALRSQASWQVGAGLRARLLDRAEARAMEPALNPSIVAALHLPDDHQVDNRLLVRALYEAAARAGATFVTDNAHGLARRNGSGQAVLCNHDEIVAESVVIAAGAWGPLLRVFPPVVEPAKGQMVEFRLPGPAFRSVVMGAGGYVVPRADGRVLAGSTDERVGFERSTTPEGVQRILDMASTLVPLLREAPVRSTWTGFRPATADALPILGRLESERLFVATGHYRNGILLTPITANLIADLVLGKPPELDLAPFSPSRPSLRPM